MFETLAQLTAEWILPTVFSWLILCILATNIEEVIATWYGPGLSKSVIHKAGDFIFIPADVPHQPVNRSTTQPAKALVARNDPNEQESVVLYDPASDA